VAKIKITRTIIISGEESWVRSSCDESRALVGPDKPFVTASGTIVETSRVEEPFNG
jgi:hypothetical protein